MMNIIKKKLEILKNLKVLLNAVTGNVNNDKAHIDAGK